MKWYNGKIIDIEDTTPALRKFRIEAQNTEILDFKPGQFIVLDLPISAEPGQGRWRSYSISNAPEGKNIIELCVVKKEGGLATRFLFEEAVEGTIIKFKEPYGTFILPDLTAFDVVMICTGTGIAPFRSMLEFIENEGLKHKNIHLIYGTRTREDLLYYDELKSMEDHIKGFKFDFALSRDKTFGDGYKGHIHQIYLKNYSEKRADVKFMICGTSGMIDEAIENLFLKLGYDRTQILYELFG